MCRNVQITLGIDLRTGLIWPQTQLAHSTPNEKWKQFPSPNLSKNQYIIDFFLLFIDLAVIDLFIDVSIMIYSISVIFCNCDGPMYVHTDGWILDRQGGL